MIRKSDGRGPDVFYRIWFPIEASLLTMLALTIPFGVGWAIWTYGGGLVDLYVQVLRSICDAFGILDAFPMIVET